MQSLIDHGSYVPCNAKSPVKVSIHVFIIEVGTCCLSSPFTVGLLTYNGMRLVNQIPVLEKLNLGADEQLPRCRGAGATSIQKTFRATPGLNRECL